MRTSAKQYAQTLFELTDGKSQTEIEKAVASFAGYIYRNRKLKLADKIFEQFTIVYNKKKEIIEAEAVTKEKMNEALEKKVKHFIKEKYQAKEVILKNIVDKNAKGGIVLKVGDEVADGSVKGQLDRLKKELVA